MKPQWNQRAVDGFFQNLSSGSFQPAGPLEILGLLALVALIGLFFFAHARRKRSRTLRERRRRSERSYKENIGLLTPSPTDGLLLDLLSRELADPDAEKHLLLNRREVFDKAESVLLTRAPEHARDLMALRVRLGYGARTHGRTLRNSTDIPPSTLLLDDAGREVFRALSIQPGFLMVEVLGHETLATGRPLELFIARPDGKYLFRTTILEQKDARASLQHDESLKRIQVRDYFRRDITLPVRLEGRTAETLNISGGGLCVRRPSEFDYGVDDILKLSLQLEPMEADIQARVRIAEGSERGLLHLEFQSIREGDRDRIIRSLMDVQRREAAADEGPAT